MHNSSLIEILKSFTPEEMKRFEEFVSSPYFNKKSAVINLCRHIRKYSPEFKSPKLERKITWKVLYPDREYNYGIFKNLVFDLTKLADRFITIEYFQKDEIEMNYDHLDSLNERELLRLFKSKFVTSEKFINELYRNKKIPAENLFNALSRLYLLRFGFSNIYDPHKKISDELRKHTIYLMSGFLIQVFKAYNNVRGFSQDHHYNMEKNIVENFILKADSSDLISDMLDSVREFSEDIFIILDLYYKFFRACSDSKSEEKYFAYKEALSSSSGGLSLQDKHIFYVELQNCLTFMNSPGINKSKETLDIVRLKIKYKVLLDQDDHLDLSYFISVIQTACNINDSEFIVSFTDKFLNYVSKESRDNLLKYSNAHLYFSENEFQKSLETILTVDYDLFIMKYYLKDLQMMNFYELNDYDSFLMISDSFRHFLSNNKSITGKWKIKQSMFDNYLNRLFKLREKRDPSALKDLKTEIMNSDTSKKQWLIRKVSESEKLWSKKS